MIYEWIMTIAIGLGIVVGFAIMMRYLKWWNVRVDIVIKDMQHVIVNVKITNYGHQKMKNSEKWSIKRNMKHS
jgi:hypothetical protein